MLNSDEARNREFWKHYGRLNEDKRPEEVEGITQLYNEWLENRRNEIAAWKKDLEDWNDQEINKHTVFQDTRYKMGRFLSLVAQDENFLPKDIPPVIPVTVDGTWHLLGSSLEGTTRLTPSSLRTPDGFEIHVDSWKRILIEVAEWLIRKECLPIDLVPIRSGSKRYLVHTKPEHADDKSFKDEKKTLERTVFGNSPRVRENLQSCGATQKGDLRPRAVLRALRTFCRLLQAGKGETVLSSLSS